MVVISAAVCTNTGLPLVSRQFVDISRARVEGLLSAFTKLMNSEKEHTFIDTENVRYLYQPLDTLYVVLITNKSSNIMEDLDTLHLFAKLIPEYCGGADEAAVRRNSFELMFALDEVIVAGQKEKITLSQIKTFTEMDSHEERIHEIVERNKQREALEQAKLKMKEIEMQKKTQKSGTPTGFGSGSSQGYTPYRPEPTVIPQREPSKPSAPVSASGRKGMQLGSKSNTSNEYLKALKDLGEISDEPVRPSASVSGPTASAQPAVNKQGIHVEIEETISLISNQDGGLERMEIKGELKLEISDPNQARVSVALKPSKLALQSRTHPNINKQLFTQQNILALRDTSKAFPTATALGVLKWRYNGTDGDVPLNVTCWPTPSSDMTTVNLEYELNNKNLVLSDVQIYIPIPDGHSPVVENADGSYEHLPKRSALAWKIPVIDKDTANGSMEFAIPYSGSVSALFPVDVKFTSTTPLSGIGIASINSIDSKAALNFSSVVSFAPEPNEFQVQFS